MFWMILFNLISEYFYKIYICFVRSTYILWCAYINVLICGCANRNTRGFGRHPSCYHCLMRFGPWCHETRSRQAGVTTNSAGMCKNRNKGGKKIPASIQPSRGGNVCSLSESICISIVRARFLWVIINPEEASAARGSSSFTGAHCVCSTTRCQRQLSLLRAQTKLSARHLSSAGGDEGWSWRMQKTECRQVENASVPMTHLSELGSGLLFLHSAVSN